MRTVLLVDDEPNIRDLVRLYLEQDGFAVVCAADGRAALELHEEKHPDLVILDLMLPEVDGWDVARELRRRGDTPLLMLTAKSDDVDRIVGLELGADDYLVKPFNPRELVARVRAVLRRTERTGRTGPAQAPISVGALRMDARRREAHVGSAPLDLTAREFDLLAALARDPGVVLTRDALLESVWGTDYAGETRTIDMHVSTLRGKLGEQGPLIETVRGVGYRLLPRPTKEPA